MKTNLFLTVTAFLIMASLSCFYSCSDDKDTLPPKVEKCNKEQETYSKNDIQITLTKQEWSAQRNGIGGVDVSLKIAGTIQGDSATIRTFGDGLIHDVKLILDKKKKFHQDFGIFFTSNEIDKEFIEAHTNIQVFKGKDTLKVELKSCPIPNLIYKTNK